MSYYVVPLGKYWAGKEKRSFLPYAKWKKVHTQYLEYIHGQAFEKALQSAQHHNETRKRAIKAQCELLAHHQAVGFTVDNPHTVVHQTFPITEPLSVKWGHNSDGFTGWWYKYKAKLRQICSRTTRIEGMGGSVIMVETCWAMEMTKKYYYKCGRASELPDNPTWFWYSILVKMYNWVCHRLCIDNITNTV